VKEVIWHSKCFSELSLDELYDLLKLRVDVFVVEQTCFYPDLDSDKGSLDRHDETIHLIGYQEDKLVAYARILAKGQSYEDYTSIGRVAVAEIARGSGVGHELISKAVAVCSTSFPNIDIKISAQEHLSNYYQKHGFKPISDMYLEDDIPHIAMKKSLS
jgi:ElaA protein